MKLVPFNGVPLAEQPNRSENELQSLKRGCQFIRQIGGKIGFPNRTVITAQLYFRKFYLTRPVDSVPFLDIALTAIILASKVEESFEKIRGVMVTAFLILKGDSFQGRREDVVITDEHCKRVIQYERDLLISINFNFNLLHPHQLLFQFSSLFKLSKEDAKLTWILLDKIFEQTDLALYHPPHTLTLSALVSCVTSTVSRTAIESYAKENNFHLIEIKL